MEFARLFSVAFHYDTQISPEDFCSTSLSYKDALFTLDPLVRDHEECMTEVGTLLEAQEVQGALHAACERAAKVLNCDRYVAEVASSVNEGLLDGGRLCDRVLTGKETQAFDPAHFLYSCIQYAHHGDSPQEMGRKCKDIANNEFCDGYVDLISKGANRNEVEAYCQHQEVKLHSSIIATPAETAVAEAAEGGGDATQMGKVTAEGGAELVPLGQGTPHVKLTVNMFSMCQETISAVTAPDFVFSEDAAAETCATELKISLEKGEIDALGARLDKGCKYFAHKLSEARGQPDFSKDHFCKLLTKASPEQMQASTQTEAPQPAEAQESTGMIMQTEGPLRNVPWGQGKTHAPGSFPSEATPIMVRTHAHVVEDGKEAIPFLSPANSQRVRRTNVMAHSFVDTTPRNPQDGEDAFMNQFLDSYDLKQSEKKKSVEKKVQKLFPKGVDSIVNDFLKSYSTS